MSFKQRIHFRKGERWGVEKGEVELSIDLGFLKAYF